VTAGEWRPVPLRLETDLQHGGRWTSLRTAGREWLWTNPDPGSSQARDAAGPDADFVDAGGVEECLPTVRGRPDHGAAWTRPWTGAAENAWVELPGVGVLNRRISQGDADVRVDYRLTARPGTLFLHAVHALLDVSPAGRLSVPHPQTMIILDVDDTYRPWPDGLDRLGPDDGSAICALLPDCRQAVVTDRDHALRMQWDAPGRSELCSLLLWRNLGGWPADRPYTSIGIEPMIGRAADLSTADSGECVRVDDTGRVDWTLSLTALVRLTTSSDASDTKGS
jgi:hypothetical protein